MILKIRRLDEITKRESVQTREKRRGQERRGEEKQGKRTVEERPGLGDFDHRDRRNA
jgi:hypothetical protein